MEHLLDNPVWHALTGPHARVAIGQGLARHYPRDMAPFSAVAEASAPAYRDLERHLPVGVEARLFRPTEEPAPNGWETVSARPILQMVRDAAASAGRDRTLDPRVRPLSTQDVAATLELAAAASPGPFERRTTELGGFVGVFHGTGLVAMAGERFRVPGYVELSAIAVHPDARGRGLARVLIDALCRRATDRGEVPFLHVFPDNPAVALYESLGFRVRARLCVLWRRPSVR